MALTKQEKALLKKLLEKESLESNNTEQVYTCTKCDYEVSSDKPKKKCPVCKKFSLVIANVEDEEEEAEEFEQVDERKDRACRVQKVRNIKTKFVDPGGYKTDSETWDKKITFTVSPRRKPFKKLTVRCARCNRNFKIHPSLNRENWRCDTCIRPGGG